MYKIALVNMPLVNLIMPSLALTQLRSVTRQAFGDRVDVGLHYLHHDFAHFMTLPACQEMLGFEHHPAGLGEWFFRQIAFPELPDNADEYFQRYYPQHSPRNRMIKEFVLMKRAALAAHFDEMIDRYALDQADLVGFSSMFTQQVASIGMARRIKARNPKAVVVIGGANCEGIMGRELVEQVGVLDYVFSGPALRSFPRLVGALIDGDEVATHRIDGVFTRGNEVQGAACGTGPKLVSLGGAGTSSVKLFGEENDINEYVPLDYDDFLDGYEASFPGGRQPHLFFETSRGCWWGERAHCTFCGLNGSTINYRSMKPELAFRILGSLFQHADRCSHLSSVDNILPKSYLSDVLPYLDTPENIELFYEVKADLDENDFRVLRKARVRQIQPGIESLNTSTLKLMRKGTSSFQNVMFLINSVRYDIDPAWNLLIGFPREEIDVYEKYLADVPLLVHLPPPGGVFPVRFDRFSPYYDEADEYGLDLHPLDWYALTYPFAPEALRNVAYYFSDHNYNAGYAVNAAKMVTRLRERVGRWHEQWADPETRPQLVLNQRHGDTFVYDSRTGDGVEYLL
ncbi:MAG TPA: RiPP maturation radical SAM C-methyltransferase, partial [Longimicrobium sp.]|nr:RiPP maturation radical SAM C-methyltransferase [Longimicrobium sp.]